MLNQIPSQNKTNIIPKAQVLNENPLCLDPQFNTSFSQQVPQSDDTAESKVAVVTQEDNTCCSNRLWTQQETSSLFDLYDQHGAKWTMISHIMKRKSENCVKNRFYGSLRKLLRRMNKAARNLQKKFKKQLKFESITRIIDASEGLFRLKSPLKEQSEYLSKKIITLARIEDHEMEPELAQELIKEINKFNMLTRSYKSQKKLTHQAKPSKVKKEEPSKVEESSLFNSCSEMEEPEMSLSADLPHPKIEASPEQKKILVELKCDEASLHAIEEFNSSKKGRVVEDDIRELQMEILSPLQFEAWM